MELHKETKMTDTICELRCNLDDMTGEALGFAEEQLLAAGALDVFMVAIQMKKSRPAVLLTVLCHEEQREEMLRLLFLHTTTLGVRESLCQRYILQRHSESVRTPWGEVRKKTAVGYGVEHSKYEYEDLARLARRQGCSLAAAAELVRQSEEKEE